MEKPNIVQDILKIVEEYNKAIFQIDPYMMTSEDIQLLIEETKHPDLLTSERCSHISLKISQHIYGVQFRLNRVSALINYLNDEIMSIIAPDLIQYKGMSWTHTENLAIKNNVAAEELHHIVRQYKLIKDSSFGQVDILKDIAKKIESIKYERRV